MSFLDAHLTTTLFKGNLSSGCVNWNPGRRRQYAYYEENVEIGVGLKMKL